MARVVKKDNQAAMEFFRENVIDKAWDGMLRNGNQDAKADAGKLRPTLVPTAAIRAIAAIRGYGVAKYPNGGPDNWKKVEPERYRDAMARHMLAYIDDPTGKDEESGLPHLWHLICNAAFLCELENFDV